MKYCLRIIIYQILLLSPIVVLAQVSTGYTIKGIVSDKNGAPLKEADIVLEHLSISVYTDSLGNYIIDNVPEGSHKVTVQLTGYKPQYKSIRGQKDEIVFLNFVLETENVRMLGDANISSRREKERLENSAKAVYVVDTKEARFKSGDMGEVLAQTQGVSVRRSGGLGSGTRFSLNGLTGDQVRFFLDGVPLEFSGYSFGISNVPVNLVDRIEIYKGVVPVQFGADALGGAVNIVSPKITTGLNGSFSYQTGSFGTHRLTMDTKYLDSTGVYVSAGGFYDYSKNNYKVDVEVPNEKGKLQPATVRRFHDAYSAGGINVTVGVKNKKWAKELSLKGFYTDYSKEMQHNNLSMDGIPYGQVHTLRQSAGANLTYRNTFGENITINSVVGYNYTERQFIDTSHCVYDWYGNCIVVKINPGEIVGNVTSGASHQYTWDRNYYARLLGNWDIAKNHTLRVSIAPTYTYRTGKEEFNTTYDPAAAKGKMLNWVNGIEYQLDAFDGKLENIFFVKDYLQFISLEERMPNQAEPLLTERQIHYYGLGNALRYKVADRFNVKTSYEYATRLPRPDELFGDGQFIANSLELKPERSHNINLEVIYRNHKNSKSKWYVQPNFFLRKINNLIFLNLGATDRDNVYQNLLNAVSVGGEMVTGWTSPSEKLMLNFNVTYQYFYNNSKEGIFKSFYGDRIPNMPYFFVNTSASYSFKNVLMKNTQLNPFWNMRYVHSFYSSWESAGLKESKIIVPSQQIQNIGLTYKKNYNELNWGVTAEIQNLMNAKVYDFYGVQKPGRAYYVKLIIQF